MFCSCEVYIRLGGLQAVYKPGYIKENRLDHVIKRIKYTVAPEDMDFMFEWNILFSPLEDKIYIRATVSFSFYCIDSMQKAVNEVIDIFTNEDMENTTLVIF